MITIKFGDYTITDWLNITGVNRNISAPMDITTVENLTDGVELVSAKRKSKEIEVSFHAKEEFDPVFLMRTLAPVLSVKQTARLEFSDEPNVYFTAIPTGELSMTDDGYIADGKIVFLVPDGKAHRTTKAVLNSSNSGGVYGTITDLGNGSLSVDVINNGTDIAYPTIKLTNKAETGFISAINETAIFAMGKKSEADGETYSKSQMLYQSQTDNFAKFVDCPSGTVNPQNSYVGVNGTIAYQTDGLRLKTQGTAQGTQTVSGGMKVYEFPADDSGVVGGVNFYSYFNLFAWAGAMGQTGMLQVLFTDENDKFVAGYGIKKDDMSGNTANAIFWCGGNSPRELKKISFIANNGEGTNANRNFMFNSKTGSADFVKSGARLEFYWRGVRMPYTIPELATVKIAKCYLYIGQFKRSSKYMTNLAIRNIKLQKNNVELWRDIPNRYPANSVVEIDSSTGTISVDGTYQIQDKLNGANFVKLPVGKSTLLIDTSDFTTVSPDIEISWEENLL